MNDLVGHADPVDDAPQHVGAGATLQCEARTPAAVAPRPDANTTDLLIDVQRRTPDAALFARELGGAWVDVSAREFLGEARRLAKGLVHAGIGPGDRIGILSRTRYEWTLIDFAGWFAGAILVAVYETSSAFQLSWNLSDSEACALILENADQLARFNEVRTDLPGIRHLWQIDDSDLTELASAGREISDELLEERRDLARADDIATIIYTSGTTGNPKGCVLTHGNFVELTRNTHKALPEVFSSHASTLLFIPLAHVFARFLSILAVHAGVRVAHQAATSLLVETLASFQPTYLLAVPRVFEKIYNSSEQAAAASGRKDLPRRGGGGHSPVASYRHRQAFAWAALAVRHPQQVGPLAHPDSDGRPREVRRLRLRATR